MHFLGTECLFNTGMLTFLFLLGLPALVVSVSLAATQGRGYADMQTCWLNTRNYVLWAFVAPALLIVSVSYMLFNLNSYTSE